MPCPGQPLFGDQYRFCDVHSSDRITAVYLTLFHYGGFAWDDACFFDTGIYKRGDFNDGEVVDADIFGNMDFWNPLFPDVRRKDLFVTGGLVGLDRGKPAWELVRLLGGSYTEDPHEEWQIVATCTSDPPGARTGDLKIVIEMPYVAGY
jgi:hypothetical protein